MRTPSRSLILVAKSALFCLLLVPMLAAVDFVATPSVGTLNGWAASTTIRGEADVLAFGSSRTYCTILPMEMWREAGITGLDVTSAIQVIPVTAGYLEEALKEQNPRVVMVELYMVGKHSTFDVTTAHKALDYMPESLSKVAGITGTQPPGDWFELFFPLSLYHSRWSELTAADFRPEKHSRYAYARGAMYLPEAAPITMPVTADAVDETAYQQDLVHIRRMAELCEEKGTVLVLFTSPSPYRLTIGDQLLLDRLKQDLQTEHPSVGYLDMNAVTDELGVDLATDYKDDLHVNHRGAVKISRWLGEYLVNEYDVPDRRDEPLAERWNADLKKYDEVFKPDW